MGHTGNTGPQGGQGATGPAGGTTITLGMQYQGGTVFYVDETGQHGLIAALTDQSAAATWSNTVDKLVGVSGDGYYAGAMNTAIIVAALTADNPGGSFAAQIAADYQVQGDGVTACLPQNHQPQPYNTCYGDWYLPSNVELMRLDQAGLLGPYVYFSSTEYSAGTAWIFAAGNGFNAYFGKSSTRYVRSIRHF
jgi:hypothetical protein